MKKYLFRIVLFMLMSIILFTLISCQPHAEQNMKEIEDVKGIDQANIVIRNGIEIPIELISKEIILKW